MDCAPVPKLIEGPGWVFEIKLDGYRAVAIKYGDSIDFFSRRRKSFNAQYPYTNSLATALAPFFAVPCPLLFSPLRDFRFPARDSFASVLH